MRFRSEKSDEYGDRISCHRIHDGAPARKKPAAKAKAGA